VSGRGGRGRAGSRKRKDEQGELEMLTGAGVDSAVTRSRKQ
jgi:hypothetical protein